MADADAETIRKAAVAIRKELYPGMAIDDEELPHAAAVVAARRGDARELARLREQGTPMRDEAKWLDTGEDVLCAAIAGGSLEIARQMLESGHHQLRGKWGPEHNWALHTAVRYARPDAVRLLLERGALPSGLNHDCSGASTPLAWARDGSAATEECVRLLFAAGADPTVWWAKGDAPPGVAPVEAAAPFPNLLRMFVAHAAATEEPAMTLLVNEDDDTTGAVEAACAAGAVESLGMLYDAGVSTFQVVNRMAPGGLTSWAETEWAASVGNALAACPDKAAASRCLALLLDRDANLRRSLDLARLAEAGVARRGAGRLTKPAGRRG